MQVVWGGGAGGAECVWMAILCQNVDFDKAYKNVKALRNITRCLNRPYSNTFKTCLFFCVCYFSLHLSLWTAAWVTFDEAWSRGSNRSCFVLQLVLGMLRTITSSLDVFLFLSQFFSLFLSSHPSNRVSFSFFSFYELQIESISNTRPRVYGHSWACACFVS